MASCHSQQLAFFHPSLTPENLPQAEFSITLKKRRTRDSMTSSTRDLANEDLSKVESSEAAIFSGPKGVRGSTLFICSESGLSFSLSILIKSQAKFHSKVWKYLETMLSVYRIADNI